MRNSSSPALASHSPCPCLDVPICKMGMEEPLHSTVGSRQSQGQQRVKPLPERQGDRVSVPQNLTEPSHKHSGRSMRAGPSAWGCGTNYRKPETRAAAQTGQPPAPRKQGPWTDRRSPGRRPRHPGHQARPDCCFATPLQVISSSLCARKA